MLTDTGSGIDTGVRRALGRKVVPPSRSKLKPYYDDPVAFGHDLIRWPKGQGLAEYQDEGLDRLVHDYKVCIRSLHGTGKTTTEAVAILWFALTRDALGSEEENWKCATTAGAWRQLRDYLWPEVHKWARLLDWEKIGRPPFKVGTELLKFNLHLQHGSATSVASDDPALIEGVHANQVLYIFDEAKSISPDTFDAAEGAFASPGGGYALACSTPGEPNGRFYDIQVQKEGYEDWTPIHISLPRALRSGRTTKGWADKRARQWGNDSALYANRVLGEFHTADEDGVIPLAWVEAANERWLARVKSEMPPEGSVDRVGVDVARSGDDKTVLALRWGTRIMEIRDSFHEDTMKTTGRVGGVLTANSGASAIVDTDGLGAGVTDRLREQGYDVDAFHAGAKTENKDRSGELGFINVRSAAWWHMREILDPAYGSEVELPPNDTLLSDLCSPHWKITSNSRIQVESKDEIKARIHRSTDFADGVVQAFWVETAAPRRRMRFTRTEPRSRRIGAEVVAA